MVKLAAAALLVWLATFGCSDPKCASGLECQGGGQGAKDTGGSGGSVNAAGDDSGEGGAGEALPSGGKNAAGSVATGGKAGLGGKGPMIECPPECVRAVTCVKVCGGTPVSSGCCPCVEPAFDDLQCGQGGSAP